MNDLLYSGMKTIISFVLFVLVATMVTWGNDFRYLLTNEGLHDGEINSITQDSTGNMWFATWSGLIRYDGYNFEVFRPTLGDSTSLPDKKIKIVYSDSKNNLWVATSNYLSLYNEPQNNFTTFNFEGYEGESINILQLNEIDGQLIVHTGKGFYLLPLSKVNSSNYTIRPIKMQWEGHSVNYYFHSSISIGNKLVLTVIHNNASNLYVAEIDKNGSETTLQIVKDFQINKRVNSLEYVPTENSVYLATTSGLYSYSVNSERLLSTVYFNNQPIKDIIYTTTNQLYCAVDGPKLLCLDLHTGNTITYISNPGTIGSLLPNDIHSLFEDFSGNLWVGHQGQGISILNLYRKKFHSFQKDPLTKNSLNSNTIMCFEGTEKELFVGCRSGGLNVITRSDVNNNNSNFNEISFTGTESQDVGGIWDIEKQSNSLFWIATDNGLYKLEKTESIWKIKKFEGKPAIENSIRKIFVDDNNNLWLGTFSDGLIFISNSQVNNNGINYRFDNDMDESKILSSNTVHDMIIDSKNRFWVATLNGLNLLKFPYQNLDLSGKQKPKLEFEKFVAKENSATYLNSNEINCIYENYDGKIWLATQGGGINIYDPESDVFSHITTIDGLPSNDVQGILPDNNGKLWMSTLDGLVSYNIFDDQRFFTVFDAADGIKGETFMVNAFYKASDGQLFFGSDNGFTGFYPDNIDINTIQPKLAFTKFSFRSLPVAVGDTLSNGFILKSSINYSDKIVLPFERNYFKIDVASIHFQEPRKNKFMYILEGYMGGWGTKSPSVDAVEFANLPFGTYILKVKGVSSDNVVSNHEKILQIEIQPPWYRTWYMTSIFALIVILLLIGLIYIIANRQKFVYQKQLDKVALENNESKMMFLTNIAHELRTPLSLVIAPIEDLMRYNPADNYWKNHLQLIHRNSNYLLRLINQIIDFRKLNAGKLVLDLKEADIVRVIKDVVLNFKGYETSRNVNLYVKVPPEPVIVAIDVQKIEEVLYNLISNAFKHTYDNHSIIVSMDFNSGKPAGDSEPGYIRITVYNEGKELSEEDQERIFERFFKVDENIEGAGVGLSFSKSLVEFHNGEIEVESIPKKGVAFHVKLPLRTAALNDEIIRQTEESEPVFIKSIQYNANKLNYAEASENKSTILIVEDNRELREFLYNFFSRNYNCLVASNGEEAMEIIEKQSISVIISDIIMPKMDGYELCEQVKSNSKTCHIPFILLTAKHTDEQVIKGFEAGADGYLRKPFNIHLLSAQISRFIKNRDLIKEKYRTQNFMVEMEKTNISKNERFVQNIKEILENNISDPEFNVNKLAEHLNISTTQLYRRLKELTGHSPVEFIRILKLQKAYGLLTQKKHTVKEVCYLTGFNNLSYFIKCFREQFGITPANFRDNGIDSNREAV